MSTIDIANFSHVIGSSAFSGPWLDAQEELVRILPYFEIVGDYEEGVSGSNSIQIPPQNASPSTTARRAFVNFHKKIQIPSTTFGTITGGTGPVLNTTSLTTIRFSATADAASSNVSITHAILDSRL